MTESYRILPAFYNHLEHILLEWNRNKNYLQFYKTYTGYIKYFTELICSFTETN